MTPSSSVKSIQSVQRAINILELFNKQDNELSLGDICNATGLKKSTSFGILHTLLINGYLDKNPSNGKYTLGHALLTKSSLDYSLLSSRLSEVSKEHMYTCAAQFDYTCSLFAYYRFKLTCLDVLTPNSAYGVFSTFSGKSLAFHAAASGKLAMAHWDDADVETYVAHNALTPYTDKTITQPEHLRQALQAIYAQGYAVEDDEIQIGIYSVAAPIFNAGGMLVGTLSLTGSTEALKRDTPRIIPALTSATKAISANL